MIWLFYLISLFFKIDDDHFLTTSLSHLSTSTIIPPPSTTLSSNLPSYHINEMRDQNTEDQLEEMTSLSKNTFIRLKKK